MSTKLQLIAHNIRSRENVGAFFRTCDFLGVEKLWLTGYTPRPPDAKIAKVSLGAERTVSWGESSDLIPVLDELRREGYRIVGLELQPGAQNLAEYRSETPVALIVGNEVEGILPSILDRCDDVLMIPRCGSKESLNVAVAAGIACWSLLGR